MSGKTTMTVGQVGLTGTVHTVPDTSSIKEVARFMTDRGTNAVLVVGPGQTPRGLLTSHDILVRITDTGKDVGTITAGMVMSAPLITAGQEEDIGQAIAIMVHRNVRQLPIVDKTGRVVSLLTLNDVFHLHLAGTVDLTDIANRLVEMPEPEAAVPSAPDVAEEAEEADEPAVLSGAFETHLPFRPAAPPTKPAETQPAAGGKPAASRAPAPTAPAKRAAEAAERHRDGRRRRTLVEKAQRIYYKDKGLIILVSSIAAVVLFIAFLTMKIMSLFTIKDHYEPKDIERQKMFEQQAK
jgi:CBS domain-containing protein